MEQQNPSQNNFNNGGKDDNLMDGPMRINLRLSALLKHQNPSQSNFNSRSEDNNLMGRAKRTKLKSSALLEHQNPSQSNFSSRDEDDNFMGGSRTDERVVPNSQEVPCNRIKMNLPIKT